MTQDDNLPLETIVEIVVLVVFFSVVLVGVTKVLSSTAPLKESLSEDMAMMVHSLVAVPGDAVVAYPGNVSDFVFSLDEKWISIYHKDEQEQQAVRKPIFLPTSYIAITQEGVLKDEHTLCLVKKRENDFVKIELARCADVK